jgi:hypothetical protein
LIFKFFTVVNYFFREKHAEKLRRAGGGPQRTVLGGNEPKKTVAEKI